MMPLPVKRRGKSADNPKVKHKRTQTLLAVFFLAGALLFPAEDRTAQAEDSVLYASLVAEIAGPGEPFVRSRYAVFTADGNARHTGIAFAHEGFGKIHNFSRLTARGDFSAQGGVSDSASDSSTLFYILKIPPETKELRYRLVKDGLWMSDPLNPRREYDFETGTQVSVLPVEYYKVYETAAAGTRAVHFLYRGKSGDVIRLAGDFNNWDPFMYELQETSRGIYELTLPLPPGTWHYAFFRGTTQIRDESASLKAYTRDGRTASVIVVN